MNFSDKLFLSGYLIKSSFEKEAYGKLLFELARAGAKKFLPKAVGALRQPAGAIGSRGGQILRTNQPQTALRQFSRETVGRPVVSAGGAGVPSGPLALPAPASAGRLALPAPAAAPASAGRLALPAPAAAPASAGRLALPAPAAAPAAAPLTATEVLAPSISRVAQAPASAAANMSKVIDVGGVARAVPTGLSRVRAGLGDVFGGLGQATRTGAGAVASGLGAAGSAAGRGLAATGRGVLSAARNPLVQAGAVGLGTGALGAYGVNRAMGVGGAPPADSAEAAAPAAIAPASVAPASAGAASGGAATGAGPAGPVAAAAGAGVANAAGQAGIDAARSAPPAAARSAPPAAARSAPPAAAPADDNTDYNAAFKRYMGSSFDSNSKLDQSKMDYLKSLKARNIDLNAANIYNPAYGYDQF
jgi:hypothetical protein